MRVEGILEGILDLIVTRILAVVGNKWCASHHRRKGKGSFSMYIREGLVIPNFYPNWIKEKGKQVNIPVLFE